MNVHFWSELFTLKKYDNYFFYDLEAGVFISPRSFILQTRFRESFIFAISIIVTMHQTFIDIIKRFISLPKDQEMAVLKICRIKHIARGEHFIHAGDIPDAFGITLSGLLRYYYIDKKGNDFTKGFMTTGGPVSSYSAMISQTASWINIEALEDSVVAVLQYREWKQLLERHECWKMFLIAFLEMGYTVKETRERDFLLLDATERYIKFRQTYNQIEPRLKQLHVASFLGITPVALSRIRKKMGLINPG
jgi:CRP-like cAMP-binding protein